MVTPPPTKRANKFLNLAKALLVEKFKSVGCCYKLKISTTFFRAFFNTENAKPKEHHTKYRCCWVSQSVLLSVMQFDQISIHSKE